MRQLWLNLIIYLFIYLVIALLMFFPLCVPTKIINQAFCLISSDNVSAFLPLTPKDQLTINMI